MGREAVVKWYRFFVFVCVVAVGVGACAPIVISPPVISGTPTVGEALSVSTGTWSATGTFLYAWERCDADKTGCAAIAGAVAATYEVAGTDAGHRLRARVTNKAGGVGTSTYSGFTEIVPGGGTGSSGIVMTAPPRWRTFQRDDTTSNTSGHATFEVAGSFPDDGGPAVGVDWRFADGTWAVLDATPTAGTFSGTVTAPVGSGLDVRVRRTGGGQDELHDYEVNVGDVFAVTGQSNASGYGWKAEDGGLADETPQEVGGLPGSLLMNRDDAGTHTWYELMDIVDAPMSPTNLAHPMREAWGDWEQAANDPTGGGPSAASSVWPYALGYVSAVTGVPTAITVVAGPGKLMSWHQKPASGWSTAPTSGNLTAYEELIQRVEQVAGVPNGTVDRGGALPPADLHGRVRAVLHWQGESEASNASSYAYYFGGIDAWITDIAADLGVPVVAAQIGNAPASWAGATNVRLAIQDMWDDTTGARALYRRGPVLYDVPLSADPAHIHFVNMDGSLQTAKRRWALAIHDALYATDPDESRGPRLVDSDRAGQTATLYFDTPLVNEPGEYNGVRVRVNGVPQPHVSSVPGSGQVSVHRSSSDPAAVEIEFGSSLTGSDSVDVSIGAGAASYAKRVPAAARSLGSVTEDVPAEVVNEWPL
ncbi:MAG: hypothetical protein IT198_17570 [Acidimicrobiia bacterium]|nr:hypothetical protein [Acidimicrobiia bacterium]